MFGKLDRFAKFAWFVVVYNLFVILWGAWVRISGAGAGCGNHWPTCNGEIAPSIVEQSTLIEFFHRLTSGLSLVFTLGLLFWAYKKYPKDHRVRFGTKIETGFLISEALLGAVLVKFALVEDDDSLARAIVMMLHLLNTFALIGAGAVTAWWSGGGQLSSWKVQFKGRKIWIFSVISMLIVSMAGAVTALGDTIFPIDTHGMDGLLGRIEGQLTNTDHFLIQLRIVHPLMAASLGIFLFAWTVSLRWDGKLPKNISDWSLAITILVLAEVSAGLLNIWLSVPGWLQLVHLLLADLLWISLLLMGAALFAQPSNTLPLTPSTPEP